MIVTTGMLTLGSRLIGSEAYESRPATATAMKMAMTASGLATERRVRASMAVCYLARGATKPCAAVAAPPRASRTKHRSGHEYDTIATTPTSASVADAASGPLPGESVARTTDRVT